MRRLFSALLALSVILAATRLEAFDADRGDWLLDPGPYVADVQYDDSGRELILTNGLIERRILLEPAAATISLKNLATGEEFVRALSPEARVTIDGASFPVGGLAGATVANYWKEEWRSISRPL